MKSQKKDLNNYLFWPLIAATAFHFAMFSTGFLQEDAFITFRTSFNLADHGIYSFNLDEKYPGATSLFYGFYTALIRIATGNFAITIISLINVFLSVAAGWFLTESVRRSDVFGKTLDEQKLSVILFASAAGPAMLKVSGSGMETSLLIFFMSLALWALANGNLLFLSLSLMTLPFIRIDSLGFCLIIIFVCFFYDTKRSLKVAIALTFGIILLLISNKFVFDDLIPLTAQAKNIAYTPDRSAIAIISRVIDIFFHRSFLLGVDSKYISSTVYLASGAVFILSPLITIIAFCKFGFFKTPAFLNARSNSNLVASEAPRRNLAISAIALSVLLVPLAYAVGGVIFPWYLWPYSVFGLVLLLYFLFSKLNSKKVEISSVLVVTLLGLFNFFICINISEQESRYRASIGIYLKSVSKASDTVFLEPAGYIPFFSNLKTYDTVGLTSPTVLKYHKKYNDRWWIEFINSERPDYIIDRQAIHLSQKSGDGNYSLTPEEFEFFSKHYLLEKHFNYAEHLIRNRTVLSPIYSLGSSSDYFLYRKAVR